MGVRYLNNLIDRRISYTTSRIIDDTAQCLLIIGIRDYPKVGYHILDLLTLIEAQSSIDTIRDSVFPHLFLERTALGVRTIENGKVTEATLVLSLYPLDVIAYDNRLLLITIGWFEHQFLPMFIFAEHIFGYLTLIMTNQAVRRFYDQLGGTIVLFKFREFRPVILSLEVQDIVNIGTTEAIDTLCVITDDTHTPMLFR